VWGWTFTPRLFGVTVPIALTVTVGSRCRIDETSVDLRLDSVPPGARRFAGDRPPARGAEAVRAGAAALQSTQSAERRGVRILFGHARIRG
jgi:hypothetical protein